MTKKSKNSSRRLSDTPAFTQGKSLEAIRETLQRAKEKSYRGPRKSS